MNNKRLNGVKEMPQICLGTVIQMVMRMEEIKERIKGAIDKGYEHIDCADGYGGEEYMNMMKDVIEYGIRIHGRDKFWITWKSDNITDEHIRGIIYFLGCGYIDLFLIHHPRLETYNQLECLADLKMRGYLRNIGLSNYENAERLMRIDDRLLVKYGFGIYANQIQASPIEARGIINGRDGRDRKNYVDLLELCNTRNIRLMFYSPYNGIMDKLMDHGRYNILGIGTNSNNIRIEFGRKVIGYYTRLYLKGKNNVLMVGISSGKSCIINYETIKNILDTKDRRNKDSENNKFINNLIKEHGLSKK